MVDLGHLTFVRLEVEPMVQVLAEVVSHEGTHGHGIMHDALALIEVTRKFAAVLPLCSAAAVASDLRQAPVKTPCSQE